MRSCVKFVRCHQFIEGCAAESLGGFLRDARIALHENLLHRINDLCDGIIVSDKFQKICFRLRRLAIHLLIRQRMCRREKLRFVDGALRHGVTASIDE